MINEFKYGQTWKIWSSHLVYHFIIPSNKHYIWRLLEVAWKAVFLKYLRQSMETAFIGVQHTFGLCMTSFQESSK